MHWSRLPGHSRGTADHTELGTKVCLGYQVPQAHGNPMRAQLLQPEGSYQAQKERNKL